MDIKRDNCVAAFRRLGMKDADSFLGEYAQSGVFASVENGSLSAEGFRDAVRDIIGNSALTDTEINDAFSVFLIGIPLKRLEALRVLHNRYGIYMLSNTNPIMWNGFIREAFEQEGLTREDYFDGIVTSFEAKVMKPEPGIFEYTCRHLHILPSETLFLDDSEANCEAARSLGWHAACVTPGTEFTDILANMGL